jgi:tape measure domain-containing protein
MQFLNLECKLVMPFIKSRYSQFHEQINKTFVIARTSGEGVSSVMLQLTQAMAAGKLQGEELNAVLDNAQPIVQNIADYMKVPVGAIKKLASEGKISAAVIKNAMFAAADETNRKFESMPLHSGKP